MERHDDDELKIGVVSYNFKCFLVDPPMIRKDMGWKFLWYVHAMKDENKSDMDSLDRNCIFQRVVLNIYNKFILRT